MESRDLNAAAVRRILDGLDLAPGEPSFVARASTCEPAPRNHAPGESEAVASYRSELR